MASCGSARSGITFQALPSFVRRTGGKSVRQHDRHLDLAAGTQHLQRHLVAVTPGLFGTPKVRAPEPA